MPASAISWPHAPTHQLAPQGTYFITARTYEAAHHFRGASRLTVLHRGLLRLARDFGWQLEAWAVFSNHYHFVAHSPFNEPDASSLRVMLSLLHEKTAKWVNRLDGAPSRQVWFNYRDTRLTYQKSYLARLNYTHQNAVKHGLVVAAHLYPWCSASWFERTASAAQVRAIYRFRTDRMKLDDEFEVAPRMVKENGYSRSVVECGGNPESFRATPLSSGTWMSGGRRVVRDGGWRSKAVSRPPQSRTASVPCAVK